MNSIEKLNWRYATKKFDTSKKVTKNQLNTLKHAFNLTATSYGLQPIKMLVISSNSLKNKLLEHSYNQQQIVDCSHLLVICIKTNIDSSYIDAKFDLEKKIRGTSEEIIAVFRAFLKNSFNSKSSEEITNSSTNQAYIALGNLMTVCAFEGIDSCPMEGFNPNKYNEILGLKNKQLHATLLLPIGFRAKDDFMSTLKKVRFNIEDSVIEM